MTRPSSYLFYSRTNPLKERKVGTKLNRVFISEGRLTVYEKEIVRTAKSGVLFEKIIKQTTYSLHRNSSGVLFLRRSNKSVTGNFTDTSLDVLLNSDQRFVSNYCSEECQHLVESTILGWFGQEYEPSLYRQIKDQLMFPVLADPSFPRDAATNSTLVAMLTTGHGITKALREANSWNQFLLNLSPVVETMDDIHTVERNLKELLPLAVMQLGKPLSQFSDAEKEQLFILNSAFTTMDKLIIEFMLDNSTPEDRSMIVSSLLEIIKQHNRLNLISNAKTRRFSYFRSDSELSLNRVPKNRRNDLARVLQARLDDTALVLRGKTSYPGENKTDVETNLYVTLRDWFIVNVLEPQMKTKLTPVEVEDRFQQLFGMPLWAPARSFVKYHLKDDLVICSISRVASEYHENLFASLDAMVRTKRPSDKGMFSSPSSRNGYLNKDGQFVPMDGLVYSLEDILAIIERGVGIADAQLAKLGREATPANRFAFLTLTTRERRFKNTWKLYDWGVHDPQRILTLKKGKISQKEPVQTYNALPDDMFYELLALDSGINYQSDDEYLGHHLLTGRKKTYA